VDEINKLIGALEDAATATTETKTRRWFAPSASRYAFDFRLCTPAHGWAQVDTSQDAPYFGTWANPHRLEIVTYCEGDVTIQSYATAAEFEAGLRALKSWNEEHGHRFLGIDPMLSPQLEDAFRRIGLSDLLH
jgi:hypothetical protein